MDADARKLKTAWKAEQRRLAQASFPAPDAALDALFAFLDEALSTHACDHSRDLTDGWLASNGKDLDAFHRWLDEVGGYCDCEVLANAGDHFEQNRSSPAS